MSEGILVSEETAIHRLKEAQKILIISHRSPDGDTLGSGLALYYALISIGKEAELICSDAFPEKFNYLYGNRDFETPLAGVPDLIVAVDLAAKTLFGEKNKYYAEKTDLCIDHHVSNGQYAKETYLCHEASSTCEIMANLILHMGITLTKEISNCLYTGLITDTGCFMYSCTGSHTHEIAAILIDHGAEYVQINEKMFGIKSKSRLAVEREVYKNMEFYDDEKIAFVYISLDLLKTSGADETDIDGVASLARQIEGVEIAITLREQEDGKPFRVSVRTSENADATKVAKVFGGGGHLRAAGCSVEGNLKEAKVALVEAAKKAIASEGE